MNRAEYKALTRGVGGKLRNVYHVATNGSPPSRSEILALLDDAGISDRDIRGRVLDEAAGLARRVRSGENAFQVRGQADTKVLAVLRELRRADSLLDDDEALPGGSSIGPAEAERIAARVHSGLDDEGLDREAERDRLRRLGVKVG